MAENPTRLSRAYLDKQIARTIKTVTQIRERATVSAGRVVPESEDIAIHQGRRLEATVVFLDISKFSQRPAWTANDQENLLRILSLFFTEMIRVIEDYGGVVEKNTGDGLMAYFVREAGDEYSPQQKALAAALSMFYATTNLINPLVQQSGFDPLNFRICMDHGPITVAHVGAARGFRGIVAIGTTANIASKMLAAAEPNTILLGSKALEGLPSAWRSEFVQLKTLDTGWIYTESGVAYAFWEYHGRWITPTT